MNRLTESERARVIAALVEGNSIRATGRMTGGAKGTVLKLLAEIGPACDQYQDTTLRGLTCHRVQCDEVWAFCHAKEKNVPKEKRGQFGYGDVWAWVAIDADSKLVPCWRVGRRDAEDAGAMIFNLASRLSHPSATHHRWAPCLSGGCGECLRQDYAMLIKMYGSVTKEEARRYSPGKCIGTETVTITVNPDPRDISTSYVERQNLTMRMQMRRFTRLTNAFSKKVENLEHALALHFMHYNFCRVHQTLKMTPAMAAGVADHVWSVGEIVALLPN